MSHLDTIARRDAEDAPPESRGYGGPHAQDAVLAESTLTPALSLGEGEGVGPIPSPLLGERVRVRGRSERANDLHEESGLGAA